MTEEPGEHTVMAKVHELMKGYVPQGSAPADRGERLVYKLIEHSILALIALVVIAFLLFKEYRFNSAHEERLRAIEATQLGVVHQLETIKDNLVRSPFERRSYPQERIDERRR